MANTDKPTLPGMPTLANLLARYEAMQESAADNVRLSKLDTTTAKPERSAEFSVDGLNDDRFGTTTTRRVVHNPPPPADPPAGPILPSADVANVTHMPIAQAKPLVPFEAVLPVTRDPSIASQTRRDLTTLERGAASDTRREGSYAATVVSALPTASTDATEAPVQGLVARVVQAKLAADTGAYAAVAPNDPAWDVRVGLISESQSLQRKLGHYSIVVIPPTMPKPAAQAFVSLLVPGGAGAYGWRFGGANAGSAPYMPSYARWLYPGGHSRVLALFEQADGPYTFGGASLTSDALLSLERWLRLEFGHELVDQGYKTMVAAGHIYVEPVADGFVPGNNLGAVRTTRLVAGVDLAIPWAPQDFPPGYGGPPRFAEVDALRRPPGFDDVVWNAMRALFEGPNPPAAGAQYSRIQYDHDAGLATAMWRAGNASRTSVQDLAAVLTWVATPANGAPLHMQRYAAAWATQSDTLSLMAGPDAALPAPARPPMPARNIFAFSDSTTLRVPVFDLYRVAPVVAGVLRPGLPQRAPTSVDTVGLRDRMRSYAAKLHAVHLYTMVERGIWPDALLQAGFNHAAVVTNLPEGMQPLCFVDDPSRDRLASSNWQLLESSYRFKGGTNKTAYSGYDVGGTWAVSDVGSVEMDASSTSYPAIDAAFRATWFHGGTIDVDTPGSVVVIDPYGYVAPLGVAPIVCARRRLQGVRVFAGGGADLLGAGRNYTVDGVRAL